ncbi:tetratricopeptide repeat protein [Treponema sp. OMZ 857]|uniref:tetratricopeptide repeat protein n=1 Tax=Treponema sp. OMZ 857 TaxID=1643513 RepID=UPI0020A5CD9F|nr:tetratricopeptide repeat protein [Treponema sp. OMZ 857]UTC44903.1 tetratricopeptide repeat protein [Treponema sp. OMZ 857]
MNDLHKYLIGTAAGIVLCLLIWGGYSLIFGGKGTNNVPISTNELNGGAIGTASGQSSDILGNNGFFAAENDSNELTQEQQERLLAAQAANESLAKKYGTQDGSNLQNQQSLLDSQTDGTGSAYPGVFGYDALALNRGTQEQETARAIGNQKLEEDRNKVRGYIVQGKSAAQKNQLDNALTAFEHADEAMPDDKDFEAASYHDMASSLFLLSKTTSDTQTAQKARDEAERYIKKSLAARNNTDARELYSNIIAEYQKAAEAKRQQALLAQQQAAERARKEDQAEQQRRQVVELIGQGKNAVNKRQLNSATSAFDRAAASMPDNKQFASDSYTEMADAMLNLAQHLSNPNDVQTSLNKAENYIKAALAAQNSSSARNLYAKILDVRKEQERLTQAKVEAQRKQQEQAAQAAAQKKAEEQRKEQERLAQARAEAQRKQQEQAAQAAAQKKAEEQRKQQERLAQAKAEAQRKQQEQAAQAAAQKKAEEQRKEQERLAQAKAEAQRKQQEQAAQAEAQRKQQEQPKTAAHKQVENLIAQGITAAQRKQLNNAILALDRASRFMPKDDDFAEESYRKMADAMFNLAENSTDKQTKSGALKKADEYIKKGLASKNTSESQALAAKITDAQSALQAQANSAAKSQTAQQTHQAAPQKNTDANNANAQAAAQARAAAQAEAAQKAQAELLAKKHEVDALVQQGKKSAASGNFAAAQSAFSKAAAQIPSGDAAFAAEQYREMVDAMQSLAKTSPAHKDQALKDAADYIKKSIASKNDDAKAHYVYAQIADAQNNGSLAVQELEAARRLDPQNAQYNYELGRKYFAQKKYPQARTAFEQAVKSNPQFEAAFFNLGMTHKIMNANDAALTAFSKAAALKPDYVRAWIEMARMQDKKRNYGEAINNYRKALSLEPSNTSALKEMAQVYSKQKDAQQAERYFKEALTLGDADPVTYYNLAAVQLELGKTAEALQNAQKALAVNDKDARFLYTYGLALEKNNRLREAEDYYTRAVTADGNYSKPRINLGRIQLEAGHLDSAEQHLLAAYREEPSNFEVNMNLGKLYGLKNQYGKAIDYYTNAIKIMPKDIDARQNLAAVYLSAGLKENARDTYRDIIKINPQAWDSYYELGKVYISLDNKAEAKAIFEQLLKQKPNYRYAAEVRKLLVNL